LKLPKKVNGIYKYFKKIKKKGGDKMGKSKMTSKAARRIQSHADRTGKNQGFKARAQSAAAKSKK